MEPYVILNPMQPMSKLQTKVYKKLLNIYEGINRELLIYSNPLILNSLRPSFIIFDIDNGISILNVSEEFVQLKTEEYCSCFSSIINEDEISINYVELNEVRKIKTLTIEEIYKYKKALSPYMINLLRYKLFIENQIDCNLNTLDYYQENLVKKLAIGHYMVTGFPGSGKTSILISRAMYMLKENPSWKILIVTYNKTLEEKLLRKLDVINTHNIEVKTFHSLCYSLGSGTCPSTYTGYLQEVWYRELCVEKVIDNVSPTYDSILIDEYQDFYDEWIKLCVKLCKKYQYKTNKGEVKEVENILLVGDRLQSIYNPKEHSWKSLGLDMRGRSHFLKTSYRNSKSHINLGVNFLKLSTSLEDECTRYYNDNTVKDVVINTNHDGNINFIEGNYEKVCNKIIDLIEHGYKYSEILILCRYSKNISYIQTLLKNKYNIQTINLKEYSNENVITITTYQSSKGLEKKCVVLLDVDTFISSKNASKDSLLRKLLYVGITRASKELVIHANNFTEATFAKELKEINTFV